MQPLELTPTTLLGESLTLSPLGDAPLAELTRVALAHPDIWRHIPYPVERPEHVERLVSRLLGLAARGAACSFVTRRRAGGELVGSSSVFLVDAAVPSVEIGATWIVPGWQRTRVNTEAKRLMLAHCFETLGCARVEFKTDELNLTSRAALARIGATEEGTLRSHMRRADGTLRDSVFFSIVREEWPGVRAALDGMLGAGTAPHADAESLRRNAV